MLNPPCTKLVFLCSRSQSLVHQVCCTGNTPGSVGANALGNSLIMIGPFSSVGVSAATQRALPHRLFRLRTGCLRYA